MSTSVPQYLLDHWLEVGRAVPWMELVVDPPFDRGSIVVCRTRQELLGNLLYDEHALGQAFALVDLCFINLSVLPPTDEWLAIKGRTTIGTLSLQVRDDNHERDRAASRRRIITVVDLLQQCSEAECAEPGFGDRL